MATSFGAGRFSYRLQEDWEQLPEGWQHRDVASVAADGDGTVYVFARDEHPVLVYSREGEFLRSWGEGLFTEPHGITIASDGTILCVDRDDHCVKRFTPDGELVQTLGTPGSPSDTGFVDDYRSVKRGRPPFNQPTNVGIAPNGDLYIGDGYGNARVHCFNPGGDLRFSWGEPGTGPGEFSIPHAVAVAPDDRVVVADRENDRVQIFSPRGELLDVWPDLSRPDDLAIDDDGMLYMVELGLNVGRWPWMRPDTPEDPPSRLSIYNLDGVLQAQWGTRDSCAPGSFYAPHGMAVDPDGDIYVAEANWTGGGKNGEVPENCHTLQKFVRTPQDDLDNPESSHQELPGTRVPR